MTAMSNLNAQRQIRHLIPNAPPQNDNILRFLSGIYFEGQPAIKESWMQVLLYQLLYISSPADPLPKVIKDFDKSFGDILFPAEKGPLPILWVLIKFYGYFFEEEDVNNVGRVNAVSEQIETFKNVNFYPRGEMLPTSDFRMPFLITLIL